MREVIAQIESLVRKNTQAEDYELIVNYYDNYNCRFAQNAISQHLSGNNLWIRYKAVIDKKSASSTINQYAEADILKMLRRTEEAALLNQADPEYCPSLDKRSIMEVSNVSEATFKIEAEQVVEIIKASIQFAKDRDCLLSGIFTKALETHHLSTKNGFSGTYDLSTYEYSMTIKKGVRETKIQVSEKDFARFNLQDQLEKLYTQFSSLNTPVSMEPETISVILRPAAVANLMQYLVWILDRKMADEGITPFQGQIGQKFFGEKFNLITTSQESELLVIPFNSSTLFKEIDWIKEGVIKQMPHNRSYAQKIGSEACSLFNVIIPGENISEAEMMKKAGRGLIINNFWYIRPNDFKTANFTGMTRDGVLYFENGEIKHSVNNFRFNESLPNITRRIISLGESVICSHINKMPSMLISDFHFVDKTNF